MEASPLVEGTCLDVLVPLLAGEDAGDLRRSRRPRAVFFPRTMKLLSHYAAACKALTRHAFVQRHPGPFLLHSSRTGGVLQAGAGGRTFDSVVVDDAVSEDVRDDVQTVFTVSQFSGKGPDLSIGSEVGAALRVPAASVSRSHAVLHLEGGRWLIEDSGSSMGTWVNGDIVEPGTRRALSPGDRLSLGALDVTFLPAAQFYDFVRQIMG